MKKLFFSCLALLVLALPMQAQSFRNIHPNAISTSYGFSVINAAVGLIDMAHLTYVHPGSGAVTGIQSGGTRGAWNIGYSRQMNSCISIGGSIGINQFGINASIYNAKLSLASCSIYSFLSTAQFDWFHTSNDVFSMYSKVGLGMMAVQGVVLQGLLKGTIVLPTFQTSFVCLEVGKWVYGYLELGCGMQGIVQMGVRARF